MDRPYYAADVPESHRLYAAAADRYQHLDYRRVGTTGLLLPAISLGLWYNFGDNRTFDSQREVLRHAFDRGITHFDLANNYGPPYGSAEENLGRMMRTDFKSYRDELIVSTKAGWDMWPGPYGNGGSRKYMLSSLDASLDRMSVDYVDIFYSHRADPDTPVEETVGALDKAVRQGKALYVGISSYSAARTEKAIEVARELGTPLVVHQPAYSLLNRWVERGLLKVLRDNGLGAIGFSVLAQGLLSDRYVENTRPGRAVNRPTLRSEMLNDDMLQRIRALSGIAHERGQTLAQMALSWALRPGGVTSALVGVSTVEQIDENISAAAHTTFTADELTAIDEYAVDSTELNMWSVSSTL
ncbi:L-glyceraldehyde 3-phosphate reductase [Rhodococcus sp. T2V]|uniref:L-glyceraldehyde 3-phosphate reductase n=1 Tax=Rhodococcus sp. T2V TaxID=3034164 RepID=UPI0023E2BC9B|nr:L-glyceraldehyde 3-phosphate reductase [Rhodococcus sp. T2V]MDF3306220.1 L-glyceraldehyde 3-phosphate reductase [Rhodococcus sp. T2V]